MILHHFAQQRLALLLAMKKFFYKKNATIFILLFLTLQFTRNNKITTARGCTFRRWRESEIGGWHYSTFLPVAS